MVKAGDTFLCSYPEKDKHLFIVVLDEYNKVLSCTVLLNS